MSDTTKKISFDLSWDEFRGYRVSVPNLLEHGERVEVMTVAKHEALLDAARVLCDHIEFGLDLSDEARLRSGAPHELMTATRPASIWREIKAAQDRLREILTASKPPSTSNLPTATLAEYHQEVLADWQDDAREEEEERIAH